ncbi:MAG TPA: hypothetical protein VE913_18560 [Longimicrobium sp.]|nr:hypothetical protein [Longimicrobium sp.]
MRHLLGWIALTSLAMVLVRAHHPTLLINALATSLLFASFAVAVYINHLVLIPRLLNADRPAPYVVALLLTMVGVTLAAVLGIQFVYDLLWGPDPLRYGFWFNFASDFTGTLLHVVGAAVLVWLAKPRLAPAAKRGVAAENGPE